MSDLGALLRLHATDRFHVAYSGVCACGIVTTLDGTDCTDLPTEATAEVPCVICHATVVVRLMGVAVAPFTVQADEEEEEVPAGWDGFGRNPLEPVLTYRDDGWALCVCGWQWQDTDRNHLEVLAQLHLEGARHREWADLNPTASPADIEP